MAVAYRCEPAAMPTTSEQKMNATSRVSLITLRKRIIAKAPISPTAVMMLLPITAITIATTTVIKISDWTKDFEYDRPLWVK